MTSNYLNIVAILLTFVCGSFAPDSGEIMKCNVADDCNNVLTETDDLDASIKGYCSMNKEPGSCLIVFIKGGTFEWKATVKENIGPKCNVTNDKSAVKRCKSAISEIAQFYPGINFKVGKAYKCGVNIPSNITTFFTCSVQATIVEKESGSDDTSGAGCDTANQCEGILPEEDVKRAGIFKLCFSVDRKCKKMCDRGCGFLYANLQSYTEMARIPNPYPGKCTVSTDPKIKKACTELLEELKKASPVAKHMLFNAYTCKGENDEDYPTCSIQSTKQ